MNLVISLTKGEIADLIRDLTGAAQGYSDSFFPCGENVDMKLLMAVRGLVEEKPPHVVAILSSTVLTGGVFVCENIPFPQELGRIPHYVGHPATKGLVEALGAVPAPTKLFGGLAVGESYLAIPLAVNPRAEGYTADTAVNDVSQLQAKLVTRLA